MTVGPLSTLRLYVGKCADPASTTRSLARNPNNNGGQAREKLAVTRTP